MSLHDLERYDFTLPEHLLRTEGVEPRDTAKLFVYNTATDTITHDIFRNISTYLPPTSTLIFNETSVLPARLWLTKETGGKIEVFVLINEWGGNTHTIPVRVDRKLETGKKLFCGEDIIFTVEEQKEGIFLLSLQDKQKRSLEEILLTFGSTPIPPYLKANTQTETELRKRYQTVFAKTGSSVAAPTASLHFTKDLLTRLQEAGIGRAYLSLEVGLGTFAPLTEANFLAQKLHTEYVTYSPVLLDALKKASFKIPVGTTSLRALETLAQQNITEPGTYATDIFITPGFSFHNTDALITNFHTPKSSLMLLVDAFLQHKKSKRGVVDLYQEAIANQYSFYSFGDSMLIL